MQNHDHGAFRKDLHGIVDRAVMSTLNEGIINYILQSSCMCLLETLKQSCRVCVESPVQFAMTEVLVLHLAQECPEHLDHRSLDFFDH